MKRRNGARQRTGQTVRIVRLREPIATDQWPVGTRDLVIAAAKFQAQWIEDKARAAVATQDLLEKNAFMACWTVKPSHGASKLNFAT